MPHALCSLAVVDESVVYAVGTRSPDRPPVMMKTVDGGRTWMAWDMRPWADILSASVDVGKPAKRGRGKPGHRRSAQA